MALYYFHLRDGEDILLDPDGRNREQVLVDLVGILGYYTLISMTINVFEVPAPEGTTPEMTGGEGTR